MSVLSNVISAIRYQVGNILQEDIDRLGNICLMYHGISISDVGQFNKRHTTAKVFDEQLARLGRFYSIVHLSEYFEERDRPRKKPLLAITFDDGLMNNYEVALPILKKHNAPATIYVTGLNATPYPITWADFLDLVEPKWVGTQVEIDGMTFVYRESRFVDINNGKTLRDVIRHIRPDWPFKAAMFQSLGYSQEIINAGHMENCWRLLTDDQIRKLASEPLITIGSHGWYHSNLGNLPIRDVKTELENSIAYLSGLTGKTVEHIAFPDGSYNENVKELCFKLGFRYLAATDHYCVKNDASNPNITSRIGIYNCGRPHNQLFDIYSRHQKTSDVCQDIMGPAS